MADIDKLIQDLSAEPIPAKKPMTHPLISFLKWSALACVYLGLLLACSHMRADLSSKFQSPMFLAEIGSLIVTILSCALSVSVLSFPDMHQKRWAAYAPLLPLLLLIIVVVLEWLEDSPPSITPSHSGLECLKCIVLWSIVPSGWIFYRLRKMASTHPMLAGSMSLLAASAIGCLVLRMAEQTDSINHLLLWHYLPMLTFSAFGLILGKRFLKW